MHVHVGWNGTRANVWQYELPDWPSTGPEVESQRLHVAPHPILSEPRCAAVELTVASCKGRYGALGAQFAPERGDSLLIQVPHSPLLGPQREESLAFPPETVHIGLDSEFAAAVLDAAATSDAISALGPGTLRFSVASHGLIGSSINEFIRLARVVVQLLERQPATEADIVALLRAEIARSVVDMDL